MTTTLVWTGVALWIGFCAFVVFGIIGRDRYRA
jgi:hypothetical protein